MYSLKVNDIELSNLVVITNVVRDYTPRFINNIKSYTKGIGANYKNTKIDTRTIEVHFSIIDDVKQKSDELLKILKPSRELRLVFGDQSDRFYKGYLEGVVKYEKITDRFVKGSFTLLCVNPFAYSNNLKTVSSRGDKIMITNNGTYDVYPIFTFTTTSDIRMLSIVHPTKGAFLIGESAGIVQIVAGTRVSIDMEKNIVIVGNSKRLYPHVSSRNFGVENGSVEIGVVVNAGATIPQITTQYREVF